MNDYIDDNEQGGNTQQIVIIKVKFLVFNFKISFVSIKIYLVFA